MGMESDKVKLANSTDTNNGWKHLPKVPRLLNKYTKRCPIRMRIPSQLTFGRGRRTG